MKKISISKIAELAGVSKTTVSFVLNNKGNEKNISQDTQKRIIKIVKENNFKANSLARSLSTGKSHTLGFVIPDISNPFYSKIARHIERYAEQKGCSVMIASTDEDFEKEKRLVEEFKSRQVDGIILASSAKNQDEIQQLNPQTIPFVLFDRVFDNPTVCSVEINNYESSKILTQHLIDKGHRKIALISLTSYLPSISQRINGFKSALEENNIEVNPELIIELNHQHKKLETNHVLKQLFSSKEAVSAILFMNNVLASESIWAINTMYPHLTDRLLLASFDHIDWFNYSRPNVISAEQPTKEIAKSCINLINKQFDEAFELENIQLKTRIVNQ